MRNFSALASSSLKHVFYLILLVSFSFPIYGQDCDTLSFEWENPAPNTVIYHYGSGRLTGIPDPYNSTNPTDPKTIFEGFTSPNPGSTPVGAVLLGLGFLSDANDNTRIDVLVYDDNSGKPGNEIGGVTGLSPTSFGISSHNFKDIWITFPTLLVPTTSTFYIGVVMHPGDASDELIIRSNGDGQGNGDGSNSITTSKFGNEKILNVYSRDIDLKIIAKLGIVEDASFSYAKSSYCSNESDPTPTISGDAGGTFTSSPSGLSVNSTNGKIDLSASTAATYKVTYTTSGSCPVSKNQTITIVNDKPTITCPGNQTGNFDSNCHFTLPDYTSLASASDNCSTPSISQSPVAGSILSSSQTITLTANDGDGNITSCTFNLTLTDNIKPTITCPADQNVSFDSNCEFTLTDYTTLATTDDNCGTVTVSQSPTVGTVITTSQLITLTADDGNGNTETCTFNVIPADNTKPTITCPADQNVSFDANCEFTLTDYTALATTTDNCGTVTVTQSPAVGTVITTTQLITLTADDGNGNTETCTFNVIPADNSKPTITCPADQNVSFDANCEFTLTDYTALATTDDNCGTVTVTQSPVVGTVITTSQLITLTADDGNGNTETCTFNVIPEDNTKPTITCPADQNVSFDSNCEFTLTDYTALATTDDNCGTVTVTQSPAVGTVITTTQLITLTADDGNGNTETCTFNVIPEDNSKPTITCPAGQNVSFDSNCEFTLTDYTTLATTSDNCGTVTITQSPAVGTVITTTQLITLTADDGNGNTETCTFNVIPADNTKPTITCPSDQNVSFDSNCEFTLTDYTALATTVDNCGIVTVTQSPAVGTVITTTQLITLTADDGNGNTETCTFNVIPADNTKPTITCPEDQNVSYDSNCEFTLTDYTTLATTDDNCGTVTVTQSPAVGTVIITTQLITLTADDGNGNTETCTFNVIPADNSKPSITCPGDQNVSFDSNCEFTLTDYTALATTDDNCGTVTVTQSPAVGTVITTTQLITLIADDGNGNTENCTFNVIPTDNTKPTITCPADQHVSFDANCEFTLTDYTSLATTSDNCGTVSVFQSPAIGTVVTSTQLITLTADDGNGNTETCTFNVIPADNTKPTIQCINDITSCDAIIHFESPTASDNCYVTVELISGIPSGSEFPVGTTVNEYLATDPSGNTASCSVSITRYAPVSIDAGDDTTIDAGFTHTITTTTTEAIEFEWTPTDGLDDPFTQNPTASPQKNTTYTVWAYSENGCSASDDITISINQEMEINNFFSPNGDGKNDYWEVKGNWLLDDCQIKIVDAWGKQVYQSIGYDNSWDGRYNGQSLPEGTYYYTISCSEASVKTGAITLQRVR